MQRAADVVERFQITIRVVDGLQEVDVLSPCRTRAGVLLLARLRGCFKPKLDELGKTTSLIDEVWQAGEAFTTSKR